MKATVGSAAHDLFSAYKQTLDPFKTELIKTDLQMEIPNDYYGLVSGRSGLALKGISAHVGTIDSNFGGVICLILTNLTNSYYIFDYGDRIGQMTILKCEDVKWIEVNELFDRVRSKKGFGSTGK